MKVRATQLGYYGHKRKKEGEEFLLVPYKKKVDGKEIIVSAEAQFSESWMVKVTGKSAKHSVPVEESEPELETVEDQEVI